MTRIIVLSDTHGFIDQAVLNHLHWADEVWHAGDFGSVAVSDAIGSIKPLKGVCGNIDGTDVRSLHPAELYFFVEGVSVYITHIAGYPGRYSPQVRKRISYLSPQIVVCGHSHILKVMYDNTLKHLHINPGAAGKYGQQQVRTLIRFEINAGNIQNMEVIEIPLVP